MLVEPDVLPPSSEAGPEQIPGFEVRPSFALSGAVGVVALCVVSALLWTALIWALVVVVS